MDWENDRFENGTQKIVGESQLRRYGRFLEDYSAQLKSIEEALEDGVSDSPDFNLDCVGLQFSAYEHTSLLQLIDTDNKVLKKVLTVLATLCMEVRYLEDEANQKYYNLILFYGEKCEDSAQDCSALVLMSQVLPHLQELLCFVKRCELVLSHSLEQLSNIYVFGRDEPQIINTEGVHFQDVFEHLGELLFILVTIDELFRNQTTFQEHWLLYKRTLKSVHHDPSKFNIQKENLKYFEDILTDLESQLLMGKVFQRAVEQVVDSKRCISKNVCLAEEFGSYLKNMLIDLEAKSNDQLDFEQLSLWMKLSTLCALNFNLFGSMDKKLFKRLWDLNKKVPAVMLVGNIVWFPEQFFLTHLPHISKLMDKKIEPLAHSHRQTYLQQRTQSLPKEAHTIGMQVCMWVIQMEISLKQESTHLKLEDLKMRCSLLLQGVHLASSISQLLKVVTNLHIVLNKPMAKTVGLALCKLMELLKGIQHVYHRYYMAIADSINHVVQHLSFQTLTIISTAKKGLVQDKKYSEKHLDVLSALVLAQKVIDGPGTKERRLVSRLALSVATQMRTFREDELVTLASLMHSLDIICDIQSKLETACDCTFLYWHRVLLPIYFGSIYENKTDIHRLAFMFGTQQDCVRSMDHVKHAPPRTMKNSLDQEVSQYFRKQVIQPLCHDIETNLRLHVHSHLQLENINPFTVGVQDFTPFVRLEPLRFLDKYINVKGYIEHYLDETFYNLTTVALHDWRTYGEMRSLARHKYGLATVEDHLPSQTLEQGLDVLEIMRNIHIFVSKYLYNLNNQIFIEQSSNNKHLNTINIRHIANSIRTHGTGIMNTTVNFTYQFLRKKFFIFSQFMYDEHIKSRLIKDLRFFRENKISLQQKYSYERADKFNKGIRKLGLTPDGQSYLDQFRMLITHIGNAMGYVRMIRSGGLHCCSNAICFVPDLEDTISMAELCEEEKLSPACVDAAKRLDHVIGNLARNFSEGTEYFKLLVDVFSPVFRDPKNMHLRNFYVIIPALTINFVEHSITCKERMSKKNKEGAAFTDDGFAMGIAYILKLLNQYAEFDSLHWFQSVQDKYKKEKAELTKHKLFSTKDDEKLHQTMSLTAKRLDIYQQEFDLLYYSLSSARIFFKRDSEDSSLKLDVSPSNASNSEVVH